MEPLLSACGNCLCGAITVYSSEISIKLGACHCHTCMQWAGGPFFGMEAGCKVKISGDALQVYQSSDWAERGFCSVCGTHLFYRLKHNQLYILSPGLFKNQLDLNFDHQVFIDQKPDYYCFSNQTQNLSAQQVFDQYSNDTQA